MIRKRPMRQAASLFLSCLMRHTVSLYNVSDETSCKKGCSSEGYLTVAIAFAQPIHICKFPLQSVYPMPRALTQSQPLPHTSDSGLLALPCERVLQFEMRHVNCICAWLECGTVRMENVRKMSRCTGGFFGWMCTYCMIKCMRN